MIINRYNVGDIVILKRCGFIGRIIEVNKINEFSEYYVGSFGDRLIDFNHLDVLRKLDEKQFEEIYDEVINTYRAMQEIKENKQIPSCVPYSFGYWK